MGRNEKQQSQEGTTQNLLVLWQQSIHSFCQLT